MTTPPSEFEELTIESVPGLQVFLRNAQQQFNRGLEQEANAVAKGDFAYGDTVHTAFQSLRTTITELIAAVQSGQTVSVGDAARLQRQYDDLIQCVDKGADAKANQQQKREEQIALRSQSDTGKRVEKKTQHAVQPESRVRPAPPVPTSIPERPVKPKTGALRIATEDESVVDAKERVTASEQSVAAQNDNADQPKKKKKRRKKKKPKTPEAGTADHVKKITAVITQSEQSLRQLKQKFAQPNLVQEMLFTEIVEGIQQLKVVREQPVITKQQLVSVSEVASHINQALSAVVDATETEIVPEPAPDEVPVVTEQAAEILDEQTNANTGDTEDSDSYVYEGISFVPTSVTNNTQTSIDRPVPSSLRALPKPDDIYETESLTEKYLSDPSEITFIETHYSSLSAFEHILDATITKIEASTIDGIDKWLGDIPASAFSFVAGMQVSEVQTFANRDHEIVSAELQSENIKYETFAEWRDLLPAMLQVVPNGQGMVFGELYAKWMFKMAQEEVE